MLASGGAKASIEHFHFPATAFHELGSAQQPGTFLGVLESLETAFTDAYTVAVGQLLQLRHPDLAQLAAQIMGVEAERRVLGRVIGGALPAMFKYGDVEFYFDYDDDNLIYLRADSFDLLNGGHALQFDPWFLRQGTPLREVEEQLTAYGIGYQRIALLDVSPDTMTIETASGVELGFESLPDDEATLGLNSISWKRQATDLVGETLPSELTDPTGANCRYAPHVSREVR